MNSQRSSLVLVVDDKEIVRYQLKRILEQVGYRVAEASNGVQGLAAYLELKPDIVLLDALMPIMDGFTCCTRIHELPEPYHAPVLMITGLNDDESVNRAFEVGAADYITKPIQRAVLLQRVRRLIDQSQLYQQLQETAAKYQNLYDSAPCGYHSLDENGVFIEINDTELKMLGYSREEVVGKLKFVDILTAESVPTYAYYFPILKHSGELREIEFAIVRKSGDILPILLNSTAVYTDDHTYIMSRSTIFDITERKWIEKALKESEERYRLLYNNTPVMLHSIDCEGKLLNVSQYWLNYLGYEADEVLGKKFSEFMVPTSQFYAKEVVIPEFVKQGQCTDIAYQVLKKNGEVIDVLLSAIAEYDTEGNFLRSLSVMVDVTARNKAESLVKERDERFQLVAKATNDAIWDWDKQTNLMWWGDGFNTLFGYNLEQIPRQLDFWLDNIHPDDLASIMHKYEDAVMSGAEFWVGEYRFRRADHSWANVLDRSYILRDKHGNPTRVIGAMMDITNRKRSEAALRASQQKLSLHIEQNPLAVIECSIDSRISVWNHAAEKTFGYTKDEVINHKDIDLLVPPSQQEQVRKVILNLLATKQNTMSINSNITKDGREIICEWHNTVLTNQDNEVIAIVSIAQDITERVQYEKNLIDLNEQLQNQSIRLEAVNKELESFSYSVSHDLRSPLRIVDGFSLALLEDYGDQLNDEGKFYLQQIRNSTQRMDELINDLLQLSRLNRVEMQYEQVNLTAMVEEISQTLKLQDPQRDCQFIIAANVLATGDPKLLRIALENLLGNAWKFTSKKTEAWIEFSTELSLEDTDQVIYCIKDNGAGFNMSYANKLFGAFQRLHKTDEFPGTGIGLATVQRVVNRHGGKIWAKGKVGEGAAFYFTL